MLAREIVQDIKKPNTETNIIIKLDMATAYDRVSWGVQVSELLLMYVSRWNSNNGGCSELRNPFGEPSFQQNTIRDYIQFL